VPGGWDGFETAARAVIGEQLTSAEANRVVNKLVVAHGELLRNDDARFDGLTHLFPTAKGLAGVKPSALDMPRTLAAALSSLAAVVVADPHAFAPRRTLEDAVARFCALPGIVEATAQYIAMHQLHEPDAFPATHPSLLCAMTHAEGRGHTPATLALRAERWRPWRAYAAAHLWALDAKRRSQSLYH
jgi:AraC family transcriptional regulator of adaptative response / DNA-3-methyladenine glycosylase II